MNPARSLRIALVQTQAENAGAQEISRLLAEGLVARGHEVRQVFFFRRTASFDDVANAVFCARARPSNPVALARFFWRLGQELRAARAEVTVTFQHFGNLIGTVGALLTGCRHIVANQNTPSTSIPLAVKVADLLYGLLGLYERIVVNSHESEALFGRFPRPYAKRVVRIDHGFADKSVAIGKPQARAELGLPLDISLLGCAARLHPGKNIAAAIRILTINTEQHLALAGQGAERDNLETLARDLGVRDRVHFVGELDSHHIGVFFAALDCFVFSSVAETFGLAVAEAAQAGLPVVSNRLTVLEEVLAVDGQPCALFVDTNDTPAFAAAARRLLEDPILAGELTARGRRLGARFPLDGMIRRYIDLIESLA